MEKKRANKLLPFKKKFLILIVCLGMTTMANSQVLPPLKGGNISVNGKLDTTICYGESVNLSSVTDPSGGEGDYVYSWWWTENDVTWTEEKFDSIRLPSNRIFYNTTKKIYRKVKDDYDQSANSDTVTITVIPLPSPPTANNVKVCYDGNVHTASAIVGSGQMLVWYAAATGIEEATAAPSRTEPGITTAYAAAKTSEGCESARTAVSVTIDTLPNAPAANNVKVCYDGIAHTASATVGSGQTLVWYAAETGSEAATAPSRTEPGITTAYAVAKTSEGCESARTAVSVTIDTLPNAPTANNVQVCYDGIEYTASATLGSGQTLVWYSTETGIEATTAPSRTEPGITTAYAAAKNNISGCESERTAVSVTIDTLPNAPTANNVKVCYDGNVHTASATVDSDSDTVVWYAAATGNATVNAPSITEPGIMTAYAAARTSEGCESETRTLVTVTVTALPDAPSLQSITACYDGQEHKIVEPIIEGQTIVWYSDTFKTQLTNISALTEPETSTAYYPAIQAATGCESAVGNPVTVTVNALPTAPSIDNVTACYDGYEHKVDEPDIEGETIVWYKDATGSETVAPSRTDIGTTTVYAAAKITATGCESATRSKVTVEVKRIALVGDITVTGEQTICSGSTTTLTVNSAVENPVYKWYSSQDTDTPFHTGNEYITPELTETATYYISVSGDGVCENIAGDRKYVKVTVNQAPELTSPLKPETILSNSDFNYTAKSSIEGTEFSWKRLDVNGISQTASAGAMDLIAEMLTNLTLQPVEVDYLITLTSPEGCTATQTVTATVYPVLDPPKITSQPPAAITYSVCEQDAKNIEIKAETVAGTTLSYQWYSNTVESFDGVAVSGATDSLFTIPADLPAGNYYYYCEITSMSDFCATVTYSDIIAVTVEPENADFVSIAVNGDLISLQNSVSEYMAECGEFALLDIVSSSKYARITVNGVDYSENHEVQLIKDETEVVVRILACDGATVHEHTLTILKALPSKLLYMRWDDVIAVNRNETNNGNFHKDDILGVRWYKRENPINTTKWFIELDSPETDYRAEINLKGKWHRICGAPVKREAPAKQIIAYPNPILTGETLTVELFAGLEEATMNIYTITGSTVKRNVPLPSKYSTTDIDLNQGIYILEIVAQNKKHGITKRELVKLIVGNY